MAAEEFKIAVAFDYFEEIVGGIFTILIASESNIKVFKGGWMHLMREILGDRDHYITFNEDSTNDLSLYLKH